MARRELVADAGEIGLQSGPSHRCTLSQELYHTRRGHLPQPTLHGEWSSKPNADSPLPPCPHPVPLQAFQAIFPRPVCFWSLPCSKVFHGSPVTTQKIKFSSSTPGLCVPNPLPAAATHHPRVLHSNPMLLNPRPGSYRCPSPTPTC